MIASLVVDCANTLGEGCVADPRDGAIYWTDIEESRIWRLGAEGIVASFDLPERAGFILPRTEPGFIIGFATHIAIADAAFSSFSIVCPIEPELPQTRVNDAAVDPFGGIVFGTFDERDRQPVAALYRLSPSGQLARILGDVTISNGIAFSPAGDILYFADTPEGRIRRFVIGGDLAAIREIEPLAGADIAPGKPDGAVVDRDGFYWSARVWGGCLARIAPTGRLDRLVDLPARGPTCVALGGPDLTRLYATTLRTRQSAEELEATPLAGGLFAVDVEVAGLPQRLVKL